MPKEDVTIDPVTVLGQNYAEDLLLVRKMNPVSITKHERDVLSSIAIKYDILEKDQSITKDNFFAIKGKLSAEIQERLEKLAIENYLDSVRETKADKRQRLGSHKRQPVPDVLNK